MLCPIGYPSSTNSGNGTQTQRLPRSDGHWKNLSSFTWRIVRIQLNSKSLNEFKRLMFALAARRLSQTQSWTRRNEVERHKAALREDAAKAKAQELADEWLKGIIL